MNKENMALKVNLDYSKYLKDKNIPIYVWNILEKISKHDFQEDLKKFLVQFQCYLSDDIKLKTIFVNLGWNDKSQNFSNEFDSKELDNIIRKEYGLNINYYEEEDLIIKTKKLELIKNIEEIETDKINDHFGFHRDYQVEELNETKSENLDFKSNNPQKLNDKLYESCNYLDDKQKLPSNITISKLQDQDISKFQYNYYTNEFFIDKKNDKFETNSCLRILKKSENEIIELENSDNYENAFLNKSQITHLQSGKKCYSVNDGDFNEESNSIKKPIATTVPTNFCSIDIQKKILFEKYLDQNPILNINNFSGKNLYKEELLKNNLFFNNFNNDLNQFNSITNYNSKFYNKILNTNNMKNISDNNINMLDNQSNENQNVHNPKFNNVLNCYNPLTILNTRNLTNNSFNLNKTRSISPEKNKLETTNKNFIHHDFFTKSMNNESNNNLVNNSIKMGNVYLMNENQDQPEKGHHDNDSKTNFKNSYNFESSIFTKNSLYQNKTVLNFPRSPGLSFNFNANSAFNACPNYKEIPLNSPDSTKSLDVNQVNSKKQSFFDEYSSGDFKENNICNYINYNLKKQDLNLLDRNSQILNSLYKNCSKSNPVTIISNRISCEKLEKFNFKKLKFFENDENEKLTNINKISEVNNIDVNNFINNDNTLNLENSIFSNKDKETRNNYFNCQNLKIQKTNTANNCKIIDKVLANKKANKDKILNEKEDSKKKTSNFKLGFENQNSLINLNFDNPNITIINKNNSFKIILNKEIINLIENEDMNFANIINTSKEKSNVIEIENIFSKIERKHKRNIQKNKRFFDEENFLYENCYFKKINNDYKKSQNKFVYKEIKKNISQTNVNKNMLGKRKKVINMKVDNKNRQCSGKSKINKLNEYLNINEEYPVKIRKNSDIQYITKFQFEENISQPKDNFNVNISNFKNQNLINENDNHENKNLILIDDPRINTKNIIIKNSLDYINLDNYKRSDIKEQTEIQQISRKRKRKINKKVKKLQIKNNHKIYKQKEYPSRGISFGLKEISKNVLKIIKSLKSTTYKEISDLIIRDINFDLDASKDEKNIRRRIYDSLNVMKAMNIFKKEKNQKNIVFDSNNIDPCRNIIYKKEDSNSILNQNLKFERQRLLEKLQKNENSFYGNALFVNNNFYNKFDSTFINGLNSKGVLNQFFNYSKDNLQNKNNLNFEEKLVNKDEFKNIKSVKNLVVSCDSQKEQKISDEIYENINKKITKIFDDNRGSVINNSNNNFIGAKITMDKFPCENQLIDSQKNVINNDPKSNLWMINSKSNLEYNLKNSIFNKDLSCQDQISKKKLIQDLKDIIRRKKQNLNQKILENNKLYFNSGLIEKIINSNKINDANINEVDKLRFPFICVEFPKYKHSQVLNLLFFLI